MSAPEIGNVIRLTMEVLSAGTPTDASTVTLVVTDPTGSSTTYTLGGGTVTHDSTGNYHTDVTMNTIGNWAYVWSTTSPVASASSSIEIVNHAQAGP